MSLTEFHRYENSVRWRLTAAGVEIEGRGLERTPGEPQTVTRIWETYHQQINAASQEFGVPCVLIIATAATESSGRANAMRKEPKYRSDEATPNQISAGIMQTLISTARSALRNPAIDRNWLFDAGNSFRAGTAYISQQKPKTNFDPPKVAAAYNAGGVYTQTGAANRWKMRQYPIGTGEHCDRFVRWFNDAVAVLATHPVRPAVPYETLLGDAVPSPGSTTSPQVSNLVELQRGPSSKFTKGEWLHPVFRMRLETLYDEVPFTVTSGGRSTKRQAELYRDFLAGRGNPANRPGTSWHEYDPDNLDPWTLAQAADIEPARGKTDADLHRAAPRHGLHFPIKGEPWHIQPIEAKSSKRTKGQGLGPIPESRLEEDVIRIITTTNGDGTRAGVYVESNLTFVRWVPNPTVWDQAKRYAAEGKDEPVLVPRVEFDLLEKVGQAPKEAWPA